MREIYGRVLIAAVAVTATEQPIYCQSVGYIIGYFSLPFLPAHGFGVVVTPKPLAARLRSVASILRELAADVSQMFHFCAHRACIYVGYHLFDSHVFSRFLRAVSRTFRQRAVKSQLLCQLS